VAKIQDRIGIWWIWHTGCR